MLNSNLLFYHALNRTNTSACGGRMSATQIISGVLQNVFPHVFSAERLAGNTIIRKLFAKVADDDDGTLYAPAFCIDGNTLGDDWCYLWAGTQRDTAADITGSERFYGGGLSTTGLIAGKTQTVTVDIKSNTMAACIQNGDKIRITNKATPDSTTGTVQWVTVSGAPTVVDNLLTLTFTEHLADSYAIGAKISSIYQPGDLKTSLGTISKTSAAGTYDDTNHPWVLDNIGSTDEDIAIAFTDNAGNFTVTGDSLGLLGSGNISTDFVVTNANFGKPRLTIPAGFWTGTWATGDTLSRTIHPAAFAGWEKKVTPAGASSMSNNRVTLVWSGEALS